ncbi:MAG: ATPase [Lachnospiraceae bacterium]|jgi:N-acetylglucosamine kinase-like BadF-type ATPase|nr:ATPase [Lachnospiraceae bacterium]
MKTNRIRQTGSVSHRGEAEDISGGYYIGMDGGGTSTTILVWDGEQELFRTTAGGLNYNSFGPELVQRTLRQVASDLTRAGFAPKDCLAIGIGCAGVSNPAVPAYMREKLAEAGYGCPVLVVGDEEAAMAGGLRKQDGMLLISGTGSVCLGQAGQGTKKYRTGGYGHLIDDEGSAYAMGRDILSAVIRAEDGRDVPTVLRQAVFERLGISSIPEMIGYVYDRNHTKKEIAALASLLSLPQVKEDAAAKRIMDKAAGQLKELVATVARRIREDNGAGELTLVLHGSVLKKNERIREQLKAGLAQDCPAVRLEEAANDAARGAAELAGDLCR